MLLGGTPRLATGARQRLRLIHTNIARLQRMLTHPLALLDDGSTQYCLWTSERPPLRMFQYPSQLHYQLARLVSSQSAIDLLVSIANSPDSDLSAAPKLRTLLAQVQLPRPFYACAPYTRLFVLCANPLCYLPCASSLRKLHLGPFLHHCRLTNPCGFCSHDFRYCPSASQHTFRR